MKSNIQISKLLPGHLKQYNELLCYAFQVTEKTLMDYGWENDDIRQSKFLVLEKANVLGCFDGDKLVSQFAVYPIKMNIHGTVFDIGFITSVSTYPEYSGMGLMSKLMWQSLSNMRELGQSVSILYPYSIPLYRHKGWEIISDKMSFQLKDSQLPQKIHAPGYVRRVEYDNPDLIELHSKFASKTHGCLYRNELIWNEYWRWDVDDTKVAIYYNVLEEPTGYIVYLLNEDVMHIKEIVFINMEACKGLWKYISAHESMINSVKGYNYSSEPIAFWLEDSDIKETIRPYIMGRIVDVELFLKKYAFNDIKRDAKITFVIKDSLLKWNNREITIQFSPKDPPKILTSSTGKKVILTINSFTTMMLGYKLPSYLYAIERLTADAETITLLDNIIPKGKPYISDYF